MLMGKIGAKSAAFINHKPFHPGRLQNIEKVWIAQEKDKKEKAAQEELFERRKQEVRIEELRKALRQSEGNAEASGRLTLATEGMEWMYENPAAVAREREQEEFRLGKKVEDVAESQDAKALKSIQESAPGTLFAMSMTRTTEDTIRKLREDPLFTIRQAEHQRRNAVKSNPFLKKIPDSEADASERIIQGGSSEQPPTTSTRPSVDSRPRRRSPSPRRGAGRSPRSRSRSPRQGRRADTREEGRARRREAPRLSSEERHIRIQEMSEAGRQHERNKDSRIASMEATHRIRQRADESNRSSKGGRHLFHKIDRAACVTVKREDRLRAAWRGRGDEFD